jgi:hypothetical protein
MMATTCEELLCAYRQEENVYKRIMELVREQNRIMDTDPDARAVVDLCELVHGLMAEIALMESAIEPVKRRWEEQDRLDPEGALENVLSALQESIGRIAAGQQRVQEMLLDYARSEQRRTQAAQTGISASRAQLLYGRA